MLNTLSCCVLGTFFFISSAHSGCGWIFLLGSVQRRAGGRLSVRYVPLLKIWLDSVMGTTGITHLHARTTMDLVQNTNTSLQQSGATKTKELGFSKRQPKISAQDLVPENL
ncbi:hypothetical protein CPB83DRAFT_644469 [Crepidotus variabilis]|uniref:Uncharacterized protein n=1 Tax=Crepidotus variabilis TaxID=179855 RepID=A0A9P6JKK2_9AGAR|nr:hypothetical protein CPB83DRAFT_644469 [Crepidotus variabilis]